MSLLIESLQCEFRNLDGRVVINVKTTYPSSTRIIKIIIIIIIIIMIIKIMCSKHSYLQPPGVNWEGCSSNGSAECI